MIFKLKEQLPLTTRQELTRVLAIPSAQRTAVEAEFLAGLDSDYQYNEVITRNAAQEITQAAGRTLPDENSGFAVGARFTLSNAIAAPFTFENVGDATSADFRMIGNIELDEAPANTVAATLETALAGDDNDLDYEAVLVGELGNAITIEYIDPAAEDVSLSIEVTGNAIAITLATDGDEIITTTAADIIALIEGEPRAAALVTVENHAANDGSGLVTAMAATALEGGINATGMGYAQPGALCVDYDTPAISINTGTKLLPVWTEYPAA